LRLSEGRSDDYGFSIKPRWELASLAAP